MPYNPSSLFVKEDGGDTNVKGVVTLIFPKGSVQHQGRGWVKITTAGPTGPAGPSGPSGPTGAAGGAIDLLDVQNAAGIPSIAFEGVITASYDSYIIEMINIATVNNAVDLLCQVGTGAGPTYDTTSTHYIYTAWRSDQAANSGALVSGSGGQASIKIGTALSNTAGSSLSGKIQFFEPGSSTFTKKFTWQHANESSLGQLVQTSGGGKYTQATPVTAVKFFLSSGNFSYGFFRLYGVAGV